MVCLHAALRVQLSLAIFSLFIVILIIASQHSNVDARY